MRLFGLEVSKSIVIFEICIPKLIKNEFLTHSVNSGIGSAFETLLAEKPDCIIIHAGTNGITNGINSLNSVKKIVKKIKQTSPNTKIAFSSLITRKDKKDFDKKVQDVNNRLKNYCSQTNIEYIESHNIKEEHLGKKKLHLNKRGNTIFANNLLKLLQSNFSDVEFLNCFVKSEECKSERLDISSDDPFFSSLKSVPRKNLCGIIFAH